MASPNLTAISKVVKLSPNIISILGCNPGKMTLRGTNTYIIGNGKRYVKTSFFREVINFSFIGLCLFVTEGHNSVSRRAPHWYISVQTRELGQSPICCTGGARHYEQRNQTGPRHSTVTSVTLPHPEPNPTPTHNARSIPYPYMKVITTYIYVASLQSLQWLLLYPWTSQHLVHY